MTRLDVQKRAQGRSLRGVHGPGGEPWVEKRFELSGAWGRIRNRRRARHEAFALKTLAERGIPVPPFRGLRALGKGRYAVSMVEIPGARTLEACLADSVPRPSSPCARELGRLLARAHLAGLDHPDLHPGNILVDGGGQLHLIDFHAARVGAPCSAKHRRRDLLNLEASLRQSWTPYRRLRALVEWSRTSRPGPGSPSKTERRAEARSLFLEARTKRLEDTRRRRRRYLRVSSSTRVAELDSPPPGEPPTLEATELREGWTARFLAQDLRDPGIHPTPGPGLALRGRIAADPDSEQHEVLVLEGGTADERASRFTSAGQLLELLIPAARPAALVQGAGGAALLRMPRNSESLVELRARGPGAEPGRRRRRFAAGLGRLCGQVMDRGISWEDIALEAIRVEADGTPFFAGLRAPREGPTGAPDTRVEGLRLWLEDFARTLGRDTSRRERTLFTAAFLRAAFSSASSRRRLRAEWRDG